MPGQIVFVDRITRDMLRAETEARFVFGDNVRRAGLGGQAREMRGEPNAIGVATKRAPGMADEDFFADGNRSDLHILDADIGLIANALAEERTVYIPSAGLGTGLSELPTRAPGLYDHLTFRLRALAGRPVPWEEKRG